MYRNLMILLVITLIGCTPDLPKHKATSDFVNVTFSATGSVADDWGKEWVFFAKGKYEGLEFSQKLKLKGELFECPAGMDLKANDGVLEYVIGQGAMEDYTMSKSNECAIYYANEIHKVMAPKLKTASTYNNKG